MSSDPPEKAKERREDDPDAGGRPVKGALLILLATGCIVFMNTCAKRGSAEHSSAELIFFRGFICLCFLTPWLLARRPISVFRTRRIKAHIIRGVAGNCGIGFVFWAHALMPMADATALMYAAPLFVAALSPFLLKEPMCRARWIAVCAGFAGVLLILRPSPDLFFRIEVFVGVGAALCVALVDMSLRYLGHTDDPLITVFYFMLSGVLLTLPWMIFKGRLPTLQLWPWILAMGVFTLIQQVAKTEAYRHAEAAFLAPWTYTAILWAVLTGWLFWRDIPSAAVIAGASVVVGSNLFILFRSGGNVCPAAPDR